MNREELLSMDPNILLSLINMKLRDYYDSIESLSDDMDVSPNEIISKFEKLGYTYNRSVNQFVTII